MPSTLDRNKVRARLACFELRPLFIQELGWDHGGNDMEVTVGDHSFSLQAIAHKRGMVAYLYVAHSQATFPDHPTRQKIEKAVVRSVREHIIVYAPHDRSAQYWQWLKRAPGQPTRARLHIYQRDQPGETLIQKLEQLAFTLDEEADLTIVDVAGRARAAFDVEKVTKRFYDRFRQERQTFLECIEGIGKLADRAWYASLMLNRMMFIYFIQKRGFLDRDPDYLRNRLRFMQTTRGKDRFQSFYRLFLLRLFHEGLGQPQAERAPELAELLGQVPYLNGGLFDAHDLESDNPQIHIPDQAFAQIFAFFDAYQWHLDDRPLRQDNEINPDALGYIFEKYINQKQMGAYYTKEDISGYISRNTILPFLFDQARKTCSIAFAPTGGVWRLLADDPDRYLYAAVRHGITYDIHNNETLTDTRALPPEIAAGLDDVAQRRDWNKPAPRAYALPTETWREHVARRQRYEKLHARLAAGEVTSINDVITGNLDIETFAQDVIASSEGPELIRAFWKALTTISILDPTCGSGAFLFAALNILEPLYLACLEAMQGFLDDLDRSKRKRRPETLRDFRAALKQVAGHASERYFILKSIIVDNLYGVDIMEEAVEICKLRLFLKLVAQLERYDQIEPLPDVDFNVRAGNTLVGFTTLADIQDAFVASADGQRRMLYAEDIAELERIEEDAEIADRAFRAFRAMQTEREMDAGAFADAKRALRTRLDVLRGELDRHLAREYGVRADAEQAYATWRASHQPFHWFVEFYGIMRGGGFDVIIGNPPYVSTKKLPYTFTDSDRGHFPDIYGHILLQSITLTVRNGRCGMIVPLSLTFSRDFATLRNILCDWGASWFSSYDNGPAALFAGVSQRCTIWVGHHAETGTFVAPMYRWRAVSRAYLLMNLSYVQIGDHLDVGTLGLPKLASVPQKATLRTIFSPNLQKYRTIIPRGKGKHTLGFSQTARNFISVFRDDPPCLNAVSLAEVTLPQIGYLSLTDDADIHAALAATAGELFFWYWLVRGDGFHVTSHLVHDYLVILDCLSTEHYKLLIELGKMIHAERNRWLVFKKNAGRYVGNFNYRGAFEITRRADLLLLGGLSRRREESLDIFDYVQRMLAINKYAGEKGIPADVKALFPILHTDSELNRDTFSDVDALLADRFSFSEKELDFIINYDIKYRMGR